LFVEFKVFGIAIELKQGQATGALLSKSGAFLEGAVANPKNRGNSRWFRPDAGEGSRKMTHLCVCVAFGIGRWTAIRVLTRSEHSGRARAVHRKDFPMV
jgi:hypothetical protein